MKLNFTCPERYLEAIQKSRELNDATLYECISRLAIYIAPRQWQIDEAQKEVDKYSKLLCKSFDLLERCSGKEYFKRVFDNMSNFDRKLRAAKEKFYCLKDGGENEIVISSDFAPLSFYFYETHTDGSYAMNGGIIFNEDHWEIHT